MKYYEKPKIIIELFASLEDVVLSSIILNDEIFGFEGVDERW